jgi:CheY-specific phosphatase CheX
VAASTLDILLDQRFDMRLGIHLSREAAVAVTMKMFGCAHWEVTPEDQISVAGELGNLLTGRVHARFRERNLASECSLPTMTEGGTLEEPDEASALLKAFAIPQVGEFYLSLKVRDRAHEDEEVTLHAVGAGAAVA